MAAKTPRAPRPARPAAPGVPAIASLDRCHREMLVKLDALQQLIDHLEDHGIDETAKQSARAICRFFVEEARAHHAEEERLIFPPLIRRNDAELTQHVLRLQQDHGWLEEDWLELEPQLQAVAQGYSWYELDALRHGVAVFTALYHEHIGLEESLIYPAAKAQIAAEDEARAARAVNG